jgi:hypothetical protein
MVLTCERVYDEILKQLGVTCFISSREVSKVVVELTIDPPSCVGSAFRTFHWNVNVHLREIDENGDFVHSSAGSEVVRLDKPTG